jgi:transcriptional regulator with XRE-family HTH domain
LAPLTVSREVLFRKNNFTPGKEKAGKSARGKAEFFIPSGFRRKRKEPQMAQSKDRDTLLAVRALKIGNKVRELRHRNKLTLQDLAGRTGLSKPFLSQIENNRVIPPVPTLLKLAKGLGVCLTHFFADQPEAEKVSITRKMERVRIDRRPHQEKGEVSYIYTALETKKLNKSMEPFLVEFPAQSSEEMVFMTHRGEEFIYVLEGKVEFRTFDRVETLDPGDSIYIESDLSHSFRRIGEEPARALAVVWAGAAHAGT